MLGSGSGEEFCKLNTVSIFIISLVLQNKENKINNQTKMLKNRLLLLNI